VNVSILIGQLSGDVSFSRVSQWSNFYDVTSVQGAHWSAASLAADETESTADR